jgi:hypothetical protein
MRDLLAVAALALGVVLLWVATQDSPNQGAVLDDAGTSQEEGSVAGGLGNPTSRTPALETSFREGRGSVVFEVVSAGGGPVEGLHVDLSPPEGMDPRKLHYVVSESSPNDFEVPDLHGHSSDQGMIQLDNLPAGDYPWSSPTKGVVISPREGMVTIREGETTAVTILHGTGTILVGRVPLAATPPLDGRMPHLRLLKSTGGERTEEPSGGVLARSDGRFVIQCTPGEGGLYAFWIESDGSIFISSQNVVIEEGVNDVGLLRIWPSNPVLVRTEFREGSTVLRPEEVFEPGELRGVFSIWWAGEGGDHGLRYSTMVWLNLEEPFLLHGLFPGRWIAAVESAPRFPPLLHENTRFRPGKPEFQLLVPLEPKEELQEIVLTYHLERVVEQEFRISWGGEPFDAEVFVLPVGGGNLTSIAFRSDSSKREFVPTGEYHLLLIPHYVAGEETNAQASGTIGISGDQPIVIEARPGAVVKGEVGGRTRIIGSFPPWSENGLFPYRIWAEGEWSIPGVQPNTTILINSQEVTVGPPGSEVVVP